MSSSDVIEYYRLIKDRYMAPHRAGYDQRRFAKFFSLLPERSGMSIYDFGCGSGELAAALIAQGHRVTGSDVSPDMLDKARVNAPGCELTLGGVQEMPEGRWDVVAALNVLPYLSEADEAEFFRNAARMLAPGGAVVFSHTNMLVDLVTFNRYTVEFWRDHIVPHVASEPAERERLTAVLKEHLTRGDQPPRSAERKSERDFLAKRRINPISYPPSLAKHGFRVEAMAFTHYFPMPPQWMEANQPDLSFKLEEALADSELSLLFASIVVMRAVKA